MNFRQLSYFVGVVDAGSFSRAASLLRIAQPALSQQIASLEAELGTQLLIRSQCGIQSTTAGAVLYRRARGVLHEIEQIRQSVRTETELAGDVSIALPSSLAHTFAEPIVSATRLRYSKIRLTLLEGASHLNRESLTRGLVDFALIYEDLAVPGLERHMLYRQQLFLVERTARWRNQPGVIPFADLPARGLLLPPTGNVTRQTLDRAFRQIGTEPTIVAEANSLTTLLSLVEAGLGAAILPWVGSITRPFRWLRIVDPSPALNVSLCTASLLPRSEASELVLQLAFDVVLDRVRLPDWKGAIFDLTPP